MPWTSGGPASAPDESPRFARFVDDGKVHVLRAELKVHQFRNPTTVAWLYGRQWALCGAVGEPGQLHGISEFDDRLLCSRCLAAWPGEQVELFRHPQ